MFSSFGNTQNASGNNTFGNSGQPPQQQQNSASNTGGSLFGGLGSSTNMTQPAAGGSSLFGNTNQQAPTAGSNSLFGNTATNTTASSQPGGSLFGNTGNQGGGSLFGGTQSNNQLAPSGLFGTSGTTNTPAGNSLFGSNTGNTNTAAGGLFGNTGNTGTSGGSFGNAASGNPGTTGTGLFGNTTGANNTNATGGGLFGNSTAGSNTGTAGGGIFGNPGGTGAGSTGGSLFGNTSATNTTGGSLFGNTAGGTGTNPVGGGLFGAAGGANANASGGGLFGTSTNSGTPSGGLFGSTTNPPTTGGGLFANSANAPSTSASGGLFGTQSQAGMSTNPSSLFGGSTLGQPPRQGLFGTSTLGGPTLLGSTAGNLLSSRAISSPGQHQPDALTQFMSLTQRIESIAQAWNPNASQCRFQHFFYNLVDPSQVHLYGRPPNATSDALWQKAVRENPDPSCLVPVLATGFDDLQKRVEAQSEQAAAHEQKLKELQTKIAALAQRHKVSNVTRLHRATALQTQLTHRVLKVVQHLHLLIPAVRSSAIRPEEEVLRAALEDIDQEVRRPGGIGRMRGKLNELWALVGAVTAARERDRKTAGTEWMVVDEEGLSQLAQVLATEQAGLAHLTKILQTNLKDLAVIQGTNPIPYKKARPTHEKHFATQSYRLATGGEDNHIRLWMVHPNILPQSVVGSATETPTPRPPRVEYLATLSRHSAAVNVVRFSPNGELIASAGDDGMIIIWSPTTSPHASSYGSDLSPEDLQYEKEHWKPRTSFRCTTMQVYDLAWSPTGEYIIAGSTDNCARIFTANEGKCVHEIAEHNHYVQGVAWDPLNEYIATQSSDRSMHVYSISQQDGILEVHAVGRNSRMVHRHSRTPSSRSRPRMFRRESTASETESVITSASEQLKEEEVATGSGYQHGGGMLLTPTASVPSTPSTSMFPPPSRRSSFSGSNAANSPNVHGRFGRSPSPMPALPAIRTQSAAASSWASVKLYGDESYSNFFRRLTFSPDGGLLLTPAGQFEDPSIIPGPSKTANNGKGEEQPTRGRKGNPTSNSESSNQAASSVYIYSRANFARPPIARLPGHKKASVAVKFSPILYEPRPGVFGLEYPEEPKTVVIEKGKEESINVDIAPPTPQIPYAEPLKLSPMNSASTSSIAAPSPRVAIPTTPQGAMMPSPALSATDSLRPPTPMASRGGTPAIAPTPTASIFSLSYRMLYAVATMDTVAIYDSQQAGPQTLQLQSIAHHHSLPLTSTSTVPTPMSTPSVQTIGLPIMSPVVSGKRKADVIETPLTPAPSMDESVLGTRSVGEDPGDAEAQGPPKKKRRAALTHIGDVGS
ncbi:uncharacterized protein FIBRA_06678 [Fibroporia radiculosa]|uniref:Uncharacterized protein n=1 Tax=Fibroporia radiculosa TaxID=599839 RepID=J4GC72_9APHY|nr:uncharacterized protein FIBRA_06678 [Fibroporia radiculosa]CCM04498.1 predicted protein [Fibroporia radiculosa]